MTREDETIVPELLRREIETRHPGIAGEIQDAINTLRKLQQITGTTEPGRPALAESSAASAAATATVTSAGNSHARQEVRRELAILTAGESFGRYQIVRLLGRGAMGAVYLAYDSQLERHV